jgi:hypothetical protein
VHRIYAPHTARIYDLRSTFASSALAAGVTVFELARVMGTSVRMIERHYGALLDGAHGVIASCLDAFEAELEVQSSELKLYVPSQCHTPCASTVTLALPWNVANAPVPPSNVTVP